MSSDVIGWDRDDAGIVTLTLDDPGRRANTAPSGRASTATAIKYLP